MKTRVLVLAALAGSAAALAKPLYLTVPRAFGPDEAPTVDVSFAGRGPVELRVLKPADLGSFIRAQQNLRRAYQKPSIELNPGHALARGFNHLQSPGDLLLRAIDPAFRKALAPALPERTADADKPRPLHFSEGPEDLVGVPPGMTLVHSEWLNLDLGGSEREFNVPGFEAWGGDSGYQERHVQLTPLPAGVYVLQVVQERIEGQVVLVVSQLTAQVKQTDGLVLVRVAGRDQLPKAKVQVASFTEHGPGPTATTDDSGEARLSVADPKLLLTATLEGDTAVVDTDFYSTLAVAPDVFIYSDRPIYHPGDAVKFRGIVRRPDGFLARLFTPRRRDVTVKLVSEGGAPITTRAAVDEFGSFSGTLAIPKGLDTGVLRVMAQIDDAQHEGEARVQQYVKPTFYLEVLSDQDSVKPGETIKAHVRARRYAGGPAKHTAYEVYLYRSVLESPQWVDDSGMGGSGSAVTYGSASTTEGQLSAPERLYSSLAERSKGGEVGEDSWSTAAKFDDNGEADVEVPVPALGPDEDRVPFKYSLSIRARDDQATFASGSKAFFKSDCEVTANVRASAKLVKTRAPATLSIRSTSLGGKSLGEIEGTVDFVLRKASGDERSLSQVAVKTGPDGVWRGPFPDAEVGTVFARVTLKDKKGAPWTGETSLMVYGDGSEPVASVPSLTLTTLDAVLTPGGNGELVALLPQGWGPGERDQGALWLTLTGSTLFSTHRVELKGRTAIVPFAVEKRFGSAVYASLAYPTSTGRWEERTVPFRIIPAERILSVAVQPQRAEATPLGEQRIDLRVTDSTGRGVASQLSVGVVDKAVYAVQPEFRPNVLEFFYPLVRDNVSNFYSAEFQGYGYGEALARMLGALPHAAFAAVKPPTRQAKEKDQDTAYWNPAVVTDVDGHAQVSFRLPSNQTLWTVTAVAADASGRFGEGTSEFASRGTLTLTASLPQFLREGDEAQGSVRIAHGTAKPGKLSVDVTLAASGAFGAANAHEHDDLGDRDEKILPVALKAGKTGTGEVAVSVTGLPEPISERARVAVRPAAVEQTVQAVAWGGGALQLAIPPHATVESVDLTLRASTVDAALSNVRDLLDYPYGCLEQLNSTTIPNIAVAQTLERLGAIEQLDPDSRALLVEARSRAVQGVQRILELEVKGGGFTWFSGYRQPSLPLTLIALDGMGYAAEAGLVDRTDGRIVESSRWLENQGELPLELDATRAYVLARLEGKKQAPRVRALIQSAQGGNLYPLALAVLAAERAGVNQEPELKVRLAELVGQSRDGFMQASYQPTPAFFDYPMRRVGMMAILAHAASFGDVDVHTARRRLLETLSDNQLSTFDRGTALLHSLWLIERDAKELKALPAPSVEVPGVAVRVVPRGLGQAANLPVTASSAKVGSFDGVAVLRARLWVPVADLKAESHGMSIERSYYLLGPNGPTPLQVGAPVPQGQDVFVELKIDAHEGGGNRSAYYVVEDPVPAGFVPLIEDKTYRAAPYSLGLSHDALKRRALDPERATFFFQEPAWWSDSPRSIGYVMRAQFAGQFSAPPASVHDMYVTTLYGQTGPGSLAVGTP